MDNKTLYHYGVKGMKWGVRRYQNRDGRLTAAGQKQKSASDADSKEKSDRKTALKNRRTMSDAELQNRIKRLKMEQEYKNLSEQDISQGRKMVSDIMTDAGKKVLTAAAAGTMAYMVNYAMTKEFNAKKAAEYIAPNPNSKKK